MKGPWTGLAALLGAVALAGCGSAPPAAAPPPSSAAGAAPSAKPASAAAESAKPAASAKPASSASAKPSAGGPALEKPHLDVAVSGAGFSPVPLFIANEAGYMGNHGLTVTINTLASTVANQALVAGSLDAYHGSSSVINAHLQGADSIYVAAPADRSPNILFGKKGLTSVKDLKGKVISMSGPGTTRETFMRHTLKEQGLEVDKDLRLLFTQGDEAAYTALISGNADAALVAPPNSTRLLADGYPVLVDYPKEGLHVIEPGIAMSRAFVQKSPNTIKAYLMGYLDGVKRAYDDPALAKQTESKLSKITDQAVLDSDYKQGTQQWNKNLRVDPKDIQLVLDTSTDPKAKAAKPEDFYDNSLIDAVNRDYGSKLFPDDIK
jgi:NitT/TauT family transport system substrate-binding protein